MIYISPTPLNFSWLHRGTSKNTKILHFLPPKSYRGVFLSGLSSIKGRFMNQVLLLGLVLGAYMSADFRVCLSVQRC